MDDDGFFFFRIALHFENKYQKPWVIFNSKNSICTFDERSPSITGSIRPQSAASSPFPIPIWFPDSKRYHCLRAEAGEKKKHTHSILITISKIYQRINIQRWQQFPSYAIKKTARSSPHHIARFDGGIYYRTNDSKLPSGRGARRRSVRSEAARETFAIT